MTDLHTDPATRCVHAGAVELDSTLGINTPVITSTAFDYTGDGVVRYPRYMNTINHQVAARRLAALEEAGDALITGSGMGAISATLMTLMQPGDHAVLLEGLYGGTTDLVTGLLDRLGMRFDTWDGDPATLTGLLESGTRLVMVESPTNPLLKVVDLAATAKIAHDHGALAVIDNTFATPVLQQPLGHGFDLVIHSGTKYLGGHSDLLCGAIAGGTELVERIRTNAVRLGSSLNGQDLYLLERSLKTLSLRVERQSSNALALAERLAGHPGVSDVLYPGLPGHPGHAVAAGQMSAFGGMLSFILPGESDPQAFLSRLRLVSPAVSLGGIESTICQPSRTSHAKVAAGERERLGVGEHLMRLSVGIEGIEDLWADLAGALEPS